MSKLVLSMAVGDYDRTRPLKDGQVIIDGVDPVIMNLSPEEIFFRAFRDHAFDISELSLSSYLVKKSRGDCPYVAIPVFLSRAFRHASIHVRTDRIRTPADLKGARIGIPEYQLTAIVWARELLRNDFGIEPQDAIWVRGGIDQPGRKEKIALTLPASIRLESAPEHDTLSAMLDRGDIDAFIAPRPPSCVASNPHIAGLYRDPQDAAQAYFRLTGIFPIMHIVGIREPLAERHPWLPVALFKAFTQAKHIALERLADTTAAKATLPFVNEQLQAARALMGEDFWPYGVAANRTALETFLHAHHRQGLSVRQLALEEIFHPSCYETALV